MKKNEKWLIAACNRRYYDDHHLLSLAFCCYDNDYKSIINLFNDAIDCYYRLCYQ